MSHERMARGSTVAATLPVVTAFAAKVRPAATSMETRPGERTQKELRGLHEKVPMLQANGHPARSCASSVTQHVVREVE